MILTSTRALLLLVLSLNLYAQDTFEIQVYEYQTVPKGMWNLETHLNYVAKGNKQFEGSVAPTHNQIHLTYELTRGITDYFELAEYLVLARRPGNSMDFVGWRVRPRIRFPETWRLPVKISLSGEVGFPRQLYEQDSATLEIRPIIERSVGRLQMDFNPVIGRSLRGAGTSEGWDFEPGVRLGYALTKRFEPSFEYYGSVGAISHPLPLDDQVHLLFPGWDINLSDNLVWNFGIGVALTPSGNRLTYKMRLGWLFGRKSSPLP